MNEILCSPADLQAAADPIVLHLDLSPDPPALAGRTIPGARYLDLRGTFRDTESPLPNTFPTSEQFTAAARALGIDADSDLVVCDNTGNYASPRAWLLFRAMGHAHVRILDGGLPAWAAANLPLEPLDADRTYPAGNFTARPQSGWLATLDDIEGNLTSGNCTVLDARSAGRFAGTEPEPRAGLPSGHMPGAVSLPFTRVFGPDGRFLPPAELRAIFAEANPGGRPVICSCGSGITASILQVAHRLAYPAAGARNFDGSWTAYASRGDLPILTQQ